MVVATWICWPSSQIYTGFRLIQGGAYGLIDSGSFECNRLLK